MAAVFDGFFATYQRRIRDLLRIATGGSGVLLQGDLHPDLVNRIAREAGITAQSVLSMAIRAFDYLPPVDITFGDYLRVPPGVEPCGVLRRSGSMTATPFLPSWFALNFGRPRR